MSLESARAIDEIAGWKEVGHYEQSRVVSFKRDGERMNVYPTTGTVGTALDHPTGGKTQLVRREVYTEQLEQIANNPRTHTRRGYYRREGIPRRTDGGSGGYRSGKGK